MYSVLLVIHIMITIALIAIILVQRSASDGMGLSSGSSNSFMSGRAAASFVTRTTAVLATIFVLTSLALGILTTHRNHNEGSIMDRIGNIQPASTSPLSPLKNPLQPPVGSPSVPTPMAAPVQPSVPRPQ